MFSKNIVIREKCQTFDGEWEEKEIYCLVYRGSLNELTRHQL